MTINAKLWFYMYMFIKDEILQNFTKFHSHEKRKLLSDLHVYFKVVFIKLLNNCLHVVFLLSYTFLIEHRDIWMTYYH